MLAQLSPLVAEKLPVSGAEQASQVLDEYPHLSEMSGRVDGNAGPVAGPLPGKSL